MKKLLHVIDIKNLWNVNYRKWESTKADSLKFMAAKIQCLNPEADLSNM
jgi:hypothetical protein